MSDDAQIQVLNIIKMLRDAKGKFLEIGRALTLLQNKHPDALESLFEPSKLSRRRAYYFVEINEAFADQQHLHQRLRRLGWSKVAPLAKHVDAENFQDLLDLAETVTAHELKAFLKEGENGLGARIMTFAFDAPQNAAVRSVLKAYGAYETSKGLRDKEAALLAALGLK